MPSAVPELSQTSAHDGVSRWGHEQLFYLKVVVEEGDKEEREENEKVISGRRLFLWSCGHSLFPLSP